MADLRVNIAGLDLVNPVLTASGTFGYGIEYQDFIDLSQLGGVIVKGTTLQPREGNPYPRMAETAQGMLNCVGLQNKGVDYFCEHIYPQIKDIKTNMIVNVSGNSPEDYAECARRIDELDCIPAIELNISCPNVKHGGMAFGTTPEGAASVVKAVREAYKKTLIVKLSPNVSSITDIALAVQDAGADAVSLINTLMGMAIDIEKRKRVLSIGTGGLSGPAVKPIALRMVWQTYKAVKIPIVGIGGIMTAAAPYLGSFGLPAVVMGNLMQGTSSAALSAYQSVSQNVLSNADTILLLSVIIPFSSCGTLKSHLTKTFFP